MPNVQDLLSVLESLAPSRFAFENDKIGLQVGDTGKPIKKGAVSLDRSLAAVEFAASIGADVLVTHHPLIWTPLAAVDSRTYEGRAALALARADIAFIAAHTNWDCAQGGVNDTLAGLLGLRDIRSFGHGSHAPRLKLTAFCPKAAAQGLIDAASKAGAGVIGAYARCAFIGQGEGTFEPGPNASPAVGRAGEREVVEEARVEMLLAAGLRPAVERAVREAHPYEEPALDWTPLAPEVEQPCGRVGAVDPATLDQLSARVEDRLQTKCWAWGDRARPIRTVAVVGGSADEEWRAAQEANADVLVTGEVKQHVALECVESCCSIIAAGHYATEHPGCRTLRERLALAMSDVSWELFEPKPGEAGRPL